MKKSSRNKSRSSFSRKIAALFSCVALLPLFFSISSCNMGFSDFPTFFKNYTEEAAIEVWELDRGYPKDADGNMCISSDDDKVITFYLRNPQHFTDELGIDYSFTDEVAVEKSGLTGGVSMVQDDQDSSIIRFSLSQDFLTQMDMGGTLDTHIELYQIIGGSRTREFPFYDFSLKCNSEPPAVRNLTVLQYEHESSQERYVLAFNMPDMSTIHKDIVTVSVNGKDYTVDLSGSVNSDSVGVSLADGSPFVVERSRLLNLKATGSRQDFLGEKDARAVYFITEQALSDKEIPFEIVVKDAAGLKSSSSVTAYAERLSETTASYDDGGDLSTNDDGYAPVTFYAPADNADAIVYFAVYDSTGKIVKQGHGKGKVSTNLAAGAWNIESWAHKSGFVDSYPKKDSPLVSGALYVDPLYTGEMGESDGGKETPFTEISQAFTAAQNAQFPGLTIILKNDVSLAQPVEVNTTFDYVSINGQGKYSIQENTGVTAALLVGNGQNEAKLRLSNVGIGNIQVSSGSSVTLSGSVYSKSETCISLDDDSAKLYVNSKTGSSYINVKYQGTPSDGWETISPAVEGTKLSDEVLDLFKLKNDGFYISSEDGIGVIRIPGVKISVPSPNRMKVDLKVNGRAPENDTAGLITVKTGNTISASIFIQKSDGKYKSITVENLKLGLALDEVYLKEPASGNMTVENVRSGKYYLMVSYDYEGLSYGAQVLLSIVE